MCCTPKRGRPTPPFRRVRTAYRFLPPFFFAPPLADDFLAISLIPPFARGFCVGLTASQRCCRPARQPVRGALAPSRLTPASPHRGAGGPLQKRGGAFRDCGDTPARQAAPSASFRPWPISSRRPLRFSSPFVPPWNWRSAVDYLSSVTTGGLSGPPSYEM